MPRYALQLYSIRELNDPLPALLDRVAEAGYDGVEFANRVHEADPSAIADRLAETGLIPVSAHVPLERLEAAFEETLALYAQLGCRDLVVPHLPARRFRSERRIDRLATRLEAVQRRLHRHGFRLHYHNQLHEFRQLEEDGLLDRLLVGIQPGAARHDSDALGPRLRELVGAVCDGAVKRYTESPAAAERLTETALARLLETTDPAIGLQVDVGSVVGAGFDPVDVLERFGGRTRTIHLADVIVDAPGPMAEVEGVESGAGLLDVEAVIEAAEETGVDWIIYENDSPAAPSRPLSRGPEVFEIGTVGAHRVDR
jgi:sugar phosphate isomerase/epimerase